MLKVEELECLQEIINEEILSYLDSGYNIQDEYIILLRNILKKLNLKEIYDFEKRYYIDKNKSRNRRNNNG